METNQMTMPTDIPEVIDDKTEAIDTRVFENLAKKVKKDRLKEIGSEVVSNFDKDLGSCQEYFDRYRNWLKLYAIQRDPKSEPWEYCSNIGLSMLTMATLQYQASAYPALLPAKKIVKGFSFIKGPIARDKADRQADYFNYVLDIKMEDFRESQDASLLLQGIGGCVIRKVWYDSLKGRLVSDYLSPTDFVVNYDTRRLEDSNRYTQKLYYTENDIKTLKKDDYFINADDLGPGSGEEDEVKEQLSKNVGKTNTQSVDDPVTPRVILEQYVDLDLKGTPDGIKKPYIVTVDKETSRVLRIISRINPKTNKLMEFYSVYNLIPNPDGFYGYGFGLLLEGSNQAINSIVNQLIDAGTLQNTKGGFFKKGLGLAKGGIKWLMGQFIPIELDGDDIRKSLMPFEFGAPSQVLFSLLGLLQQYADRVTTVTETKTGELPASDTTATAVVALIEQGMKMFSLIHTRNHRALRKELNIIYDLETLYLDVEEVARVVIDPQDLVNPDTGEKIPRNALFNMIREDFSPPMDITLVSNPNITSLQEKVAKAQFTYQTTLTSPVTAENIEAIYNAQLALYRAMEIDEDLINKVLQPPPPQTPPDLPQEEENQIFINEGMVDALETQDHVNHLQVMAEFEASPFFVDMTPRGKANFDSHKRQHVGFVYIQSAAQQMADREQGQPQPQIQEQQGMPVQEQPALETEAATV